MRFVFLISLFSFGSFAQAGDNPALLTFRKLCSSMDEQPVPVKAFANLRKNCESMQEAELNLNVVSGLARSFRRECLQEMAGKGSEVCHRMEGRLIGSYKGMTSEVCKTPAEFSGHEPPAK